MPGPWKNEGAGLDLKVGSFIEGGVVDPGGRAQGTVVLGVKALGKDHGDQPSLEAMFLGCSDPHYLWWMEKDGGRPLRERGWYHLCGQRVDACGQPRGKSKMIHLTHYDSFQRNVRNFNKWLEERQGAPAGPAKDPKDAPAKWHGKEGSSGESSGSRDDSPEAKKLRTRLEDLRKELQRAEKAAEDYKESRKKTKKTSRKKDKKDKKDKKEKKEKKAKRSRSPSPKKSKEKRKGSKKRSRGRSRSSKGTKSKKDKSGSRAKKRRRSSAGSSDSGSSSSKDEPETGFTGPDFWGPGLKKIMSVPQRPSYLVELAYRYLDSHPSTLQKAVEEQAAVSRGEEGRPHRAAEARRVLPMRLTSVETYCKKMPSRVATWVCAIVEVLNHLYAGGKRILGVEQLSQLQEEALDELGSHVDYFMENEYDVNCLARLSPESKEEILMVVLLAPLTKMNLRARMDPEVTITWRCVTGLQKRA
eukprot:Skav230153  [mRNA]  locus=scaffold1301:548939:552297:- [translate_table: standard]